MSARHILLEIYDAALCAVDGRACVARFLQASPPRSTVHVFAVGKAAAAMARGAQDVLGGQLDGMLVITKDGHADPLLGRMAGVLQLESAHPVPDQRSLDCGAQLERRVQELPAALLPLFLVSGGSSSLVESLRDGATLAALRALNEAGLASGLDIVALNAKRAALSRLKGGGIARLLQGRRALALFISDVPGDDPDVIGSGWAGRDGDRQDSVERVVVASVDDAVRAASRAATARGLELEIRTARFEGAVEEVARAFVAALRSTSADGLAWGGESTVRLPAVAGRGGRNLHLALAAARLIRAGEPLTILAAGTDGTDGSTTDAGAIVDAGTVERAEVGGCDVERAFREFDSAMALEMAGDLVHTGPTGTNVGDLLVGIKRPAGTARGRAPAHML